MSGLECCHPGIAPFYGEDARLNRIVCGLFVIRKRWTVLGMGRRATRAKDFAQTWAKLEIFFRPLVDAFQSQLQILQ